MGRSGAASRFCDQNLFRRSVLAFAVLVELPEINLAGDQRAMEIRYLADHPEFIPTLVRWFHAQWGHLSPGSTPQTTATELQSHLHHNQMSLALVAVSGAQLVGSASLRLHDMRTRKDLSPWLA